MFLKKKKEERKRKYDRTVGKKTEIDRGLVGCRVIGSDRSMSSDGTGLRNRMHFWKKLRVDLHSHFRASAQFVEARCLRVVGQGLLEKWQASVHGVEGDRLCSRPVGSSEGSRALEYDGGATKVLKTSFPRGGNELALSEVFGEEIKGRQGSRSWSGSHKIGVQSAAFHKHLGAVQVGRVLVVDILGPATNSRRHVTVSVDTLPADT